MSKKYTVALTALILGVTSLAQAQQSASDTARREPDRVRDKQALTTDTIKLHHDIALKDSAWATLLRDRTQTQADEKRLDALRAALEHDRKASPRNTAAIAKEAAAVKSLEKKVDMDRDRANREEARLDLAQNAVRRESHAAFEEHRDIRSDAAARDADRDRVRDKQALTTDTIKLHHDIALKDSAQAMVDRDRTQLQADEKRLDALRAALEHDRKASPRNTAAIAKEAAAVKSLEKKVDMDRDRANREEARLDLAQNAVRRESHAAFEEHRDIRQDRPKSQDSTGKPKHG